jgi:hypothetical protein
MRAFLVSMGSLVLIVAFLFAFTNAIQNPVYQDGLTTRYQAQQQTKRVEAQQWGDTLRTWGMWGGGGLAAVGGLAVIAWGVVQWQGQRTKRHEATEDHTTQRHLISAKRDIALAYIAQCGDPRAYIGILDGMRGVFLPSENEFVPIDVCRAELAAASTTALARQQPQDWSPVGLPGDSERKFMVVRGDW